MRSFVFLVFILGLRWAAPSEPTLCSPCFEYGEQGLHVLSTKTDCKKPSKAVVVNVSDITLNGFLSSLPLLASLHSSSSLYVPSRWTRNAWIRFLLKASSTNAVGVNLSSHCIDGAVTVYQPNAHLRSLGDVSRPLESVYRQACGGRPSAGGEASPALVLNPPDAPSSFPSRSTELERFLLRQGLAYEFVTAPTNLCEQVSWLQRPWRAAFSVDGPHLLHMVSLAPRTPLFVAFANDSNAATFCSLGAALGARWHAVIGGAVLDCAAPTRLRASPPAQQISFVETALGCYGSSSAHCRASYPLPLDAFSAEALLAVRTAAPSVFASPVQIGPKSLETVFYSDVWPKFLAKFLSKITTVVKTKLKGWSAAKPPNWTTLFDPKTCIAPGAEVPTFPMASSWQDLRPTPYDPAIWTRLGDASKPAPNLFVISYNTMMGGSACMCLKSALRLGYQVNFVGYWRSKAFDYMKMAPHYMEDKIWHGIMIAREMTNRGRGEDIILMYDGSDAFFQHPADVLMERFLVQKSSSFMSVEARCSPNDAKQCADYTRDYFPADLRNTGVPFGYLNGGLYIGYASFLHQIFYTCFTTKVEAEHRGQKVPYWYFKNSDQKFLYYMYMGCPLDKSVKERIKLDHFQDAFGNLPDSWGRYDWDPLHGMWYLKADALGTSPQAVAKAKKSVPERAPVVVHFPGNSKQNYLGWNRMSTTLVQGHTSGAVSPKLSFQCSTVLLAEFREAYVGEICPLG